MMKVFNKGDKEYFEWMDANPNGFVLNTGKGKSSGYFVLHNSNCTHITPYDSLDTNAYTMKGYVKIASCDVEEIIHFCRTNRVNFSGEFRACKSCKPEYSISLSYPNEILDNEEELFEGARKIVYVNSYERNSKARQLCIDHHGCFCKCCGFSFRERFGSIGGGFIHVHHLRLISEVGENYKIDPVKDLIPLCPNCHAMIHQKKPPYSLEELKEIVNHNDSKRRLD